MELAASIPLRLVLLDDHEPVRFALARRLGAEPRLDLVAHTADVAEACELVTDGAIDVALVDPRRRDGAGIAAIGALARSVRGALPLIAVYATYFESDEWLRAQAAGAHDWILKQPDINALVARLGDALRRHVPRR